MLLDLLLEIILRCSNVHIWPVQGTLALPNVGKSWEKVCRNPRYIVSFVNFNRSIRNLDPTFIDKTSLIKSPCLALQRHFPFSHRRKWEFSVLHPMQAPTFTAGAPGLWATSVTPSLGTPFCLESTHTFGTIWPYLDDYSRGSMISSGLACKWHCSLPTGPGSLPA